MEKHTIDVSEPAYQHLLEQSARLNIPPGELIERLLVSDVADLLVDTPPGPASDEEALAAFKRLTTLFADVRIEGFEQMLNDPMLELINVDLNDNR